MYIKSQIIHIYELPHVSAINCHHQGDTTTKANKINTPILHTKCKKINGSYKYKIVDATDITMLTYF
jgi:hypothetical protein